jgi:hypothetical protein
MFKVYGPNEEEGHMGSPVTLRAAIAVALAATAGLAVFVATGLGKRSARSQAPYHVSTGSYRPVQLATVAKAKAKPGVSITYVYGQTTLQPGQEFTGNLRCPSKFPHPIGGGFDSNSNKTVLTTNRPDPIGTSAHTNTWAVGTVDLDTQPANVLAVVTCAK